MRKKIKKVIISTITTICLMIISLYVSVLVFIFAWDKVIHTPHYTICYPPSKLERLMFTITYAEYNSSNNSLFFIIHNTGELPIITNRLKVTIKELDRANEPSIKSIVINKKPDCKDTTLISNGITICSINNVSLDLINKYYLIITTYKDVAARYNLGR